MRDKNDPKAIAMKHAVTRLTALACELAEEYDICTLCLIYSTASAARHAQDLGFAHHLDETPPTHPQHQTVV